MEIKFGNLVLCDWNHMGDRFSSSNWRYYRGDDGKTNVRIYSINSELYVYFQGRLQFLSDIFGERSFASEDEAKQQVDDFLIRMSKLKASI